MSFTHVCVTLAKMDPIPAPLDAPAAEKGEEFMRELTHALARKATDIATSGSSVP